MVLSTGSFLADLFAVLTALVVSLYAYYKWCLQYWKRKNVPYLEPKIPFGNFQNPYRRTLSESDQNAEIYHHAKAKGLKYCGIYSMAAPTLMLTDLDLTKQILTKDFQHFTDRGFYTNEKSDPMGCHLFSVGGKKWRKLRTALSPTFTSGKLKQMFQTVVDSGIPLEEHLLKNVRGGDAVNIKDILARFSIDNIGSCAFGIECNSFKEPDSLFRKYGNRVIQRTNFENLKLFFCHNFPNLARKLGMTFVQKDVSEFFPKIVDDVINYREKNNVTRNDFMQLLLNIKADKGAIEQTLTVDEIKAQCFVFFIAGFETSSTTMTFALFELALNPDLQGKVRKEINTVLSKHENKMTYDSINELHYMKQVIDETLRKYPPVPAITRECVKDYKVPDQNIIIEKGIICLIPIHAIHNDPEYYKNPEVFDPERFDKENKKYRHQYAHIPFGEGPRICIGERFGIMQTKVGLTTILKNFNVKVNKKTKLPLRLDVNSLVTSAEGDIWLTFEKL